jgi:hypothetical protein
MACIRSDRGGAERKVAAHRSIIDKAALYRKETAEKAFVARCLIAIAIGSLVALGFSLALVALGAAPGEVALGQVKALLHIPDAAKTHGAGAALVARYGFAFSLLFFTFIVWLFVGGWGRHVAETAWSGFRDDLFDPVEPFRSAVLPGHDAPDMIRPAGGSAEQVYRALEQFVRDGSNDSFRIWPPNGAEALFAWTVVVGQPGAGKTHLVSELVRQFRRLDRFGGRHRLRHRLWRLWVWLCEEAPALRRRGGHPWDAGRIRSLLVLETFLKGLAEWTPRRPTILIIDDPGPGVAAGIIKLLADRAPSFHKPVRLLFINQALPSDLELKWEAGKPVGSILEGFAEPPPPLEQQSELKQDEAALRQFVAHLSAAYAGTKLSAIWKQLRLRDDFLQLGRACQGNPFLLELAVDAIADGARLADLTSRREILAKRARVVIESLERAGLATEVDRRALSVATLADGPEWNRWSVALGDAVPAPEVMLQAFPHAMEAGELAAFVDARSRNQPAKPLAYAPPIRPDLIGDAVLDLWAEEIGPGHRPAEMTALVQLAWRSSSNVLRAAQRRAAQEASLAVKSPLTLALQARPDPAVFPSAIAYASAMIDSAFRFDGPIEHAIEAIDRLGESDLLELNSVIGSALTAPGTNLDAALAIANAYAGRRETVSPMSLDALMALVMEVFQP